MRSGAPHGRMIGLLVLVCTCAVLAASQQAFAQGTYYDYTSSSRSTRLWVPDGMKVAKGIVLFGNGASSDNRYLANNARNQAFAMRHGFVVMATAYFGNLSGSEAAIWDGHLAALAAQSGHPELENAPWVAMGMSNGGQMAWAWNALYPEKTIGYVVNKGAYYTSGLLGPEARGNPGVLVAGETDSTTRRNNIRLLYTNNRPAGALMCWVEEENTGHSWGDTMDLFLPFMDEAILRRYPADQAPMAEVGVDLLPLSEEEGWLVDQTTYKTGTTYIAPYAEYTGDSFDAGWVLNQPVAYEYRAFATYDKLISLNCSSTPDARYDLSKNLTLTVSTFNFQNWTRVEIFDGAEQIAEQTSDGTPKTSAVFNVTLEPGLHALSAMATNAAGQYSPSKIDTFVVVPYEPVHAGFGQRVYFPENVAQLDGRVDGEEGPNPPSGWTAQWSKLSGPGDVEFADANLLDTTATFYDLGVYVLRLTATQTGVGTWHADVTVNVTYPPVPTPDGPYLTYDVTELGDGLYGWTFRIRNNDGLLASYGAVIGFQGIDGAMIQQTTIAGFPLPIHSETNAILSDGYGDPPYQMTHDSWAFAPFGDNTSPGTNPLTGLPLSGFEEGPDSYAMSLYSGGGTTLGDDVPFAYIVSDGRVSWTGQIFRNSVTYEVDGQTQWPPVPGDYNGDYYVDQVDYVIWADHFGWRGLPGADPADGNADGTVDTVDYVIWADNFGQGIPPAPLSMSQSVQPEPTADEPSAAPAVEPKRTRRAEAIRARREARASRRDAMRRQVVERLRSR